MANDVMPILNCLQETRGLDFSGYRISLIERRIMQRFSATTCNTTTEYLRYLQDHPVELDLLIDALTTHVSWFFRDTLTFEYIAEGVLPAIISRKKAANDRSFRLWSAGCAMGEEPCSASILIHEELEKESLNLDVHIFATDIDEKILAKARQGQYPFESVAGVKFGLLKKYFDITEEGFHLIQKIRNSVSFSVYDILDDKTFAPSESIFGSFDMVFCRNLLIYFNAEHQDRIFDKLYRSLSHNGYLVLGSAEIPPLRFRTCLKKVISCCHIYQKG
jgi:chemotaxis methyl-accepting protein methylase